MTRVTPLTLSQIKISEDYAMSSPRKRQTRVVYVYVGHSPPSGIKKILEDFKIGMNLDNFNYENIFIAISEGETRVEVFP